MLLQNQKYNGGIQNTYSTNEWNSASWKNGVYIVCQFPFIEFDKRTESFVATKILYSIDDSTQMAILYFIQVEMLSKILF